MRIGNFDLQQRILLVAEIGNNHEGDFERAGLMVRRAAEAGADAVKFQTFRTEHYVSPGNAQRYRQLKSFELSDEQFRELSAQAEEAGLLFLSTPFDLGSVELLEPLVPAYKIASGDNTFYPLLEAVARKHRPVLLSAGLADLTELRQACDCLRGIWRQHGVQQDLAVLHCVSGYPVPDQQANLAAIPRIAEALDCTPGYSDHTLGMDACVAAAALGARVIEKHFTLDRQTSTFRDHQLSADPQEFQELVRRVRRVERLLGSGIKELQDCERETLTALRRSIAAGRDLAAGTLLSMEDLTWVRPAGGLSPGWEHELLGKQTLKALSRGQRLGPDQVARGGAA